MSEPVKYIFVITDGEYSDYQILGAATTEEGAKALAKVTGGSIEVFEDAVPKLSGGLRRWIVIMRENGDVVTAQEGYATFQHNHFFTFCNYDVQFLGVVWARDSVHAVKIINERRILMLAHNCWGKDKRCAEIFDWFVDGADKLYFKLNN